MAGNMTNYMEDRVGNEILRGQPTYLALLKGETFLVSHAYSVGDMVIPTTPNGHLYRCTTGGTSSTEPSWNTGAGGTTVSGGATFTEQTTNLEAGIFYELPVADGYNREAMTLDAWSGGGTQDNPTAIDFGPDNGTAPWPQAAGWIEHDAASGSGNAYLYGTFTIPKTAGVGDTLQIGAGDLDVTLD